MDKTILVVDDVQEDRELLEAILGGKGYRVEGACDGRVGLEKARQLRPSLVVIDILMPLMNGLELFKEMQKDKEISKTPTFILSSRAKMADSFLSLGVGGFMAKPLAVDLFLQEVDRLIHSSPLKISSKPESKNEYSTPIQKRAFVDICLSKGDSRSSLAQKRVVIFGNEEAVLQNMRQELEKLGHFVSIVKEENRILPVVQDLKPDLVLLPINAGTEASVDKIVYTIDVLFPKQKQGEVKSGASGSQASLRKTSIVLYKVEKEISGIAGEEGSLADMDSLIERCKENGASKYIGVHSPFSFISKVQEFLK